MMKRAKKVSKKGKDPVLGSAIRDLDAEINVLSRQKSSIKGDLERVSSAVNIDRNVEKQLQEKIARLSEREAQLSGKKKKLQTNLDSISDKMNKVSKIKSEMADL
jgi:chromosome segregation ATPase